MREKGKQLELDLRREKRGGPRKGAGRKATGKFGRDTKGRARAGVSHRRRARVKAWAPLHVTVRTVWAPRSLRNQAVAAEIAKVLKRRAQRELACRVIHFTLLRDHLHLIVEAADADALARGMQGLLSGLARVVNRATGCSGKVWNDRYHARALETPREVRHCLVYVMRNGRKHGEMVAAVDPFSSAAWFDGFRAHGPLRTDQPPVHAPTVWLLTAGWRKAGGAIGEREEPRMT
jgi:REP element-mobilizing transposase RayT